MDEFIYKIEKIEKENFVEIILFKKNLKNKKYIEINELRYSIFMNKKDYNNLNLKIDNIILSKDEYLNKNEEKVIKIILKTQELYNYLIKEFRTLKIQTYQQDLSFEMKYLIENNININSKNKQIDLDYISFDIETITDKFEIISISTYNPNNIKANKVFINQSRFNLKNKENKNKEYEIIRTSNEKELLERFKNFIISQNPEILIGWNVIDFDLKVIKERFEKYDIKFNLSDSKRECKLKIYSDFMKNSSADCSGLLIFDIIQALKLNFIKFEDYKLNTVAKNVLGDEKIKLDENKETENNKIKAIFEMMLKNPLKLIEYNFKDSKLTSKITEKLKLIKLMQQRSVITQTPLMKIKSPIATLDLMYLKKLNKLKYVANSNYNYNQTTPIIGAYIIEPTPGFYKNIAIFDFKSLYPSIIMTFNIDPFKTDKSGQIIAPNETRFSVEKGILPKLIEDLYLQRNIAKKENNIIKSYAIKTTMNSFYGSLASPKSRFYQKEVAGAITAFGREIIKVTKKKVEGMNLKVIYGDTDSIFVELDSKINPKNQVKEIEKKLNKFFKIWAKEKKSQKNYLIIENEKIFSKFFIASKKRYVGEDYITKKIKFTGMEAIRGDWTEFAQEFQKKLIDLIFKTQDKKIIKEFVLDEIKKLLNKKYDSKLIYKKKLTKALEKYTKITPPHVKAAREIKDFKNQLVEYIQTKNGPKHISLINSKTRIDYEYYIQKQLKGVSKDIIKNLNLDIDEIFQKETQIKLNKFF